MPEKRAKGKTANAGFMDFSLPNTFVSTATPKKGTKIPITAWGKAVQTESFPANSGPTLVPSWVKAVDTGVPTAPKETAVESKINATVAAARGGNPRLTKSGAASAAGVPKPAAPSINEPNIQQMIMA